MIVTLDTTRLALAAACLVSYGLVCTPLWRHWRNNKAQAQRPAGQAAEPGWIVAHASQTGNAEQLAAQTADTLRLAGIPVRLCTLSALSQDELQQAERILFVVSTYGEGDAPDAAAAFVGRFMTGALPLPRLHYGVLALGDSSYSHYCGFGRALDTWLQEQGAQPLVPHIEADCLADSAIGAWRHALSHLAGTTDAPDWSGPAFGAWRLAERRCLNEGSSGAPIYHIELEPLDGVLPEWQSGDLVQVVAPAEPDKPREYSIASIPSDGRVHLLVRLHLHGDGKPEGGMGVASGWLCREAPLGASLPMRLRQHSRFRLDGNAQRPLILIGNGSGIAGLRGHLRARAQAGQGRNWLLFGERHAQHDYHYGDEWEALRAAGQLQQLDVAWSRDSAVQGSAIRYVQDLLPPKASVLRQWVAQGAAIYVCGSLQGMAAGVDRALGDILGRNELDALVAENRYRRDVY
ncbi:sulfite reductase subunit alpha [Pseudoduganella ginsengisoli]|uniref:NADPH--hemoprotein reductase n=1 Tax=Pseudoduganella ginsengisoli TaxID=1462440 RepID=A0A6L6Q091_9BURK|nr:sulfite reductase subunit alpha [Pseudoduganella ginsengisoli]MTW02844.1 oxidoreductase [Pseudoduganella ginsengisoli]